MYPICLPQKALQAPCALIGVTIRRRRRPVGGRILDVVLDEGASASRRLPDPAACLVGRQRGDRESGQRPKSNQDDKHPATKKMKNFHNVLLTRSVNNKIDQLRQSVQRIALASKCRDDEALLHLPSRRFTVRDARPANLGLSGPARFAPDHRAW